jgi:uncharacterized protein YndB with AHSA1/START domain
MKTPEKSIITVRATISAPVEKVWKLWTDPEHTGIIENCKEI